MSWPDIIHALQTSVPAALLAMGATIAAFVEAARRIAKAARKRDDKAMQSVPPSQPTHDLGKRLDTVERLLSEQRAWREAELVEELGRLQKELLEARQDNDQLRAARAVDRLQMQRLRQELRRLKAGG